MAVRRLADEGAVVIDLPGATVSLDAAITREATMTDNVAGVLPGQGALADTIQACGSHSSILAIAAKCGHRFHSGALEPPEALWSTTGGEPRRCR